MIKTYDFSDNSTALPLTKAQRVLRSLGDTDSYSPHFFDDGFPKEILHTDAQAVLNVLDDIVFEREELRAKLAALESQPAVAYVRFSNGEVDYDADAVISNTPGDCMYEYIEWLPVFIAAGAAPACTSDEWLANCPQSVRDLADKIKAGAAPVPQMTGAALASQEPVAEVLLVDGEKVIDASMAFFDSVELGTKLYLAAGAEPVPSELVLTFNFGTLVKVVFQDRVLYEVDLSPKSYWQVCWAHGWAGDYESEEEAREECLSLCGHGRSIREIKPGDDGYKNPHQPQLTEKRFLLAAAGAAPAANGSWIDVTDRVERLEQLIRADERELCAKVCDVTPPYPFRPSIEAAHAIRARGQA